MTLAPPPVAGQAPPIVVDALLGTGVALAIALIIAAEQGGNQAPDAVAYLFAAAFGALLLLRRRAPLVVLGITMALMFGYYTFDYPPIGVAVPVVAALFAAADAGLAGWAVGAGVVVFAVSVIFRLRDGEAPGFLFGYEAVSNLALIAAAIALGDAVRTRRDAAAQHAEIVALTAERATTATADRMHRERERISRDLHDTVGHTMSVIALHAGVAAEAIGSDDAAATRAVGSIRTMSSRTLVDLRWIVRQLRIDAAEPSGDVLSLSAVPALAEATSGSGLAVESALAPVELAPPVDAAAFRIVQEALTNAVRHSGAHRVTITAARVDDELDLRISDDGRGVDEPVPGNGLTGMAERVRLLGGRLRIDSAAGAGFTVHARLPVRLEP